MSLQPVVLTDRLELRPPIEGDRSRFIELFTDAAFMVFSGGVCSTEEAHERFDRMILNAVETPFAKQPVIEQESGIIVGYSGVAWFEFEGRQCLEFGYRLDTSARGKGYATEAGQALLELARATWSGTIYAMIDPRNEPSMGVIAKLGFTFWKLDEVNGYIDNLYRIELP